MSTKPAEPNGFGLPIPDAVANYYRFLRFVTLFDDTESVELRLRASVMTSGVHGNRIQDASIAARMMVHRSRVLVTQSRDDSAPFDEFEALPLDRGVLNSRSSPLPRPSANHPSRYQATLDSWPSNGPSYSSPALGASAGASPGAGKLFAEPPVNSCWDRSARPPQTR